MTLIEPMILTGALVGAVVGAVLGFSTSVARGLGGLVAGGLLGGFSCFCLIMLTGAVLLAIDRGPRHVLRLLMRKRPGPDE